VLAMHEYVRSAEYLCETARVCQIYVLSCVSPSSSLLSITLVCPYASSTKPDFSRIEASEVVPRISAARAMIQGSDAGTGLLCLPGSWAICTR